MQIGMIQAKEIAKHDLYQWGGVVFLGFKHKPVEGEDEQSSVLAIYAAIPGSVANVAADEIASRKLGEVFKALITEQDPGSFLSFLLFNCLIRAKPSDWEACARRRIDLIDQKAFYLSRMLSRLMGEYRYGINTQQERESLKRLVATIYAKREANKSIPSDKLVGRYLTRVERAGIFRSDEETKESM